MKKFFTSILLLLSFLSSYAYDFEVDGVYYGLDASTMTAYVTYKTYSSGGYSGDVSIPSSVTYNSRTLDVTSIGNKAFIGCDLTSVSLPNSIISIGSEAFKNCSISSLELPETITTIGESAFYGSNLTEIIIPNSVKEMGKSVFYNCKNLQKCILSESLSKIKETTFYGCLELQDIKIPSNVKVIEYMAFRGCNSLTKLVIPSNVTNINSYAFYEVNSITEQIIEDSETPLYVDVYNNDMRPASVYIGREVYGSNILGWGYTGLKTITLGSKISGQNLPISEGLESIYSNIMNPQPINSFWNTVYINCKLYIPKGTLGKYQSTNGWKQFFQIIEDVSLGEDSDVQQCNTPQIKYEMGNLFFESSTPNAAYHYSINVPDAKNGITNEKIALSAYYTISVYSTADGYSQSETATAKLYWVDGTLNDPSSINSVQNRGLLVKSNNGFVEIVGLSNNEEVSFYSINGKLIGKSKAIGNTAQISTFEKIVIATIGNSSIKISTK